MAIWQYDVHLIPENSVRNKVGEIPDTLPPDMADEGGWWQNVSPPSDIEFSVLAPPGKSWTDAIRAWGNEDSDRIECYFDEGELCDIRFRIDVRKLSKPFVLGLLNLANLYQLLLTTDSGRLFRPDLEELVLDMQRSTAIAFATNPEQFLANLSARHSKQ